MEFTRDYTQTAKGLAILFMYIHHLFTFPRRMVDGNYYISLFPDIRFEYNLGFASVICVGIFLFLSGYGLTKTFGSNRKGAFNFIFRRLWGFYQVYWFYFIIFVPIGLIFFNDVTIFRSDVLRYDLDLTGFLKNLTGISSSYNSEWWFVWLYAALIILFPLILFLIDKTPIIFFIFCILLYFSPLATASYSGPDPGTISYWQLIFITGIYFAKFNLFKMIDMKYLHMLNSIMIVLICLLLKRRGTPDFILVPPLVLASTSLINRYRYLKKLMIFLGNYSFPMWLTHTFFCYYYFQDLIYWLKISMLVLLNLLAVTIAVVILTESARRGLTKFLAGKLSVGKIHGSRTPF